ncbi:uncharacterized protein LTR77_009869 [Saxophila tyrrhenica]|uniref:DSBA-like thioredoxin domain-containing protein n=1 Tax=Saxophila tyrrhenica TaxID=1690608 RepID=A0AAV9P1C0_9PEZI|nr:hypothetical protein LTR77_009869 [Saxophila tyrrhenica]
MAVLDISIYFDFICPWCLIGHKSLDKAINLYQRTYPGGRDDEIRYNLLPYYLKPDAPQGESVAALEAIERKNGKERVNAIRTRLERVGREYGIDFSMAHFVGSTRDAHRMLRFAPVEKRKELLEEVYRLHFESDLDITSHEGLATAAENVGLSRVEVLQFLSGQQGGEEVDELAAKARKQDGVASVPTVVIGDRRLEGAEDVGEFYEALIAAKEAASG